MIRISSFILLICLSSCDFRFTKASEYYSRTIEESKKNDLYCFNYFCQNESCNRLFEYGWVERMAIYQASIFNEFELQNGFGFHFKIKLKISSQDTFILTERNNKLIFDDYQTTLGAENYRIYFIEELVDDIDLIPILNGDTLNILHLTKQPN